MEKENKILIFKAAVKIYCSCIANPTYHVAISDRYNKECLFQQCVIDAQMLADGSGIMSLLHQPTAEVCN